MQQDKLLVKTFTRKGQPQSISGYATGPGSGTYLLDFSIDGHRRLRDNKAETSTMLPVIEAFMTAKVRFLGRHLQVDSHQYSFNRARCRPGFTRGAVPGGAPPVAVGACLRDGPRLAAGQVSGHHRISVVHHLR